MAPKRWRSSLMRPSLLAESSTARRFAYSHRFTAPNPERRRELSSKGGKKCQSLGKAHRFTTVTGSRAGKIAHKRGTARTFTKEEAVEAGKKGGAARAKKEPSSP